MSTTTPTPRFGLVTPNGDDPIKNGDDLIRAVAAALDPAAGSGGGAIQYLEGTLAAIPAAGKKGRIYRTTDTGQLLFDNGTSWVTQLGTLPQARVFNSAPESLPNNAQTVLTFDSERYDLGTSSGQHSTSSNTSRLACQVAGLYRIGAHVVFAANATADRDLFLRLNGATFIAIDSRPAVASATSPTHVSIATEFRLSVGDYIEVLAQQQSGGALNVLASGDFTPEFWWSLASA